MVYIIIQVGEKTTKISDYHELIFKHFQKLGLKLKIIPITLFFDNLIEDIDVDKDFVFFDKDFAYNNIDVVKQMQNGIVLLENETVYLRKINKLNPINENLAINHNFKVYYINPKQTETTNDDYKIIIDNKNYMFNMKQLINNE